MNMFVRLAGDLPSIEKSFFRNIVAAVIAAVTLIKGRESFMWHKGSLPGLITRSVFGTMGILCNFYAIDHLLLADASMLNKLSPFFAVIFSFLILKERVTLFQGA
ncbi:MAG: EamA family transporter, partial [Candidatus Ornithomonoglobus sp.]